MSEAFWNQVRRRAADASHAHALTRHGLITSYDPGNHAVKVELQPEGVLTGWIPLKSICAGNGWGVFCPPVIGTAVEIHFQEGDVGVGSAGLSFFNDVERPLPVPAGEIWIVHEHGAFFKLTNDGAAEFSDGQGASVRCNGDGTIASSGAWTHTGKLTATDDVVAGTISLKSHKTTGVSPGSGLSGVPQ